MRFFAYSFACRTHAGNEIFYLFFEHLIIIYWYFTFIWMITLRCNSVWKHLWFTFSLLWVSWPGHFLIFYCSQSVRNTVCYIELTNMKKCRQVHLNSISNHNFIYIPLVIFPDVFLHAYNRLFFILNPDNSFYP